MIWIWFVTTGAVLAAVIFEVLAYFDLHKASKLEQAGMASYRLSHKEVENDRIQSALCMTIAVALALVGLMELWAISAPVDVSVSFTIFVMGVVGFCLLKLQAWRNKRAGVVT